MFRFKRIAFLLVLPAMFAFLFHAAHPHAHKSALANHDCAICQTPTLGAQPADAAPSLIFTFSDYAIAERPIFLQLPRLSSESPRAPPVV